MFQIHHERKKKKKTIKRTEGALVRTFGVLLQSLGMKAATNTKGHRTAEPPCLYLVFEQSVHVKRAKATNESWK